MIHNIVQLICFILNVENIVHNNYIMSYMNKYLNSFFMYYSYLIYANFLCLKYVSDSLSQESLKSIIIPEEINQEYLLEKLQIDFKDLVKSNLL